MQNGDLRNRVRAVIAQTFEMELAALPTEPDADNIQKWDSLGHMELIEALEEEFGIQLEHAAAVNMLSEADIVQQLQQWVKA